MVPWGGDRGVSRTPCSGLRARTGILAHRIACLQRPGDAALLRAAAHDRSAFYPDGDGITASLLSEADRLDRGGPGA
ncbi:hypothetical protein [Streptomyces sp. NPDC059928]|uniref:hypothetical protein n=1 Tax=unclassified Streptomyces TaxID=2593676 RepID=UPI00365C0001